MYGDILCPLPTQAAAFYCTCIIRFLSVGLTNRQRYLLVSKWYKTLHLVHEGASTFHGRACTHTHTPCVCNIHHGHAQISSLAAPTHAHALTIYAVVFRCTFRWPPSSQKRSSQQQWSIKNYTSTLPCTSVSHKNIY